MAGWPASRGRAGRPGTEPETCSVVMGDPKPRLPRHPDPAQCAAWPLTRVPSPSHAAAAACLSTSGPPAIRRNRAARRLTLQARRESLPVPRDTPRHDLVSALRQAHLLGRRVVPRRSPMAVNGYAPVRALLRHGVPCLAMRRTADAALSQRGTCGHPPVPSHAGLFVPATLSRTAGDCGAP